MGLKGSAVLGTYLLSISLPRYVLIDVFTLSCGLLTSEEPSHLWNSTTYIWPYIRPATWPSLLVTPAKLLRPGMSCAVGDFARPTFIQGTVVHCMFVGKIPSPRSPVGKIVGSPRSSCVSCVCDNAYYVGRTLGIIIDLACMYTRKCSWYQMSPFCYTCSIALSFNCYTCSISISLLFCARSIAVSFNCYTSSIAVSLLCYTVQPLLEDIPDNKDIWDKWPSPTFIYIHTYLGL